MELLKKASCFLPTRKGSERVKNKNTRPFAKYSDGGLLQLKLEQLIKVENIQEIVLSTNDEECLKVGKYFQSRTNIIKIDERPDQLASSATSLTDLVKYAGNICSSDHILWTHVTSPFIDSVDYSNAIKLYFESLEKEYDSLMTVLPFQNFLWSKERNEIINRINNERWPRTQDLQKLYEIDSGIFIAAKTIYLKNKDRVGLKPYLMENNKIKAFDIDWEEDFLIAEAIYERLYK